MDITCYQGNSRQRTGNKFILNGSLQWQVLEVKTVNDREMTIKFHVREKPNSKSTSYREE